MLEWIKYDDKNPPELGKCFLVCVNNNYYYVGKLKQWLPTHFEWEDCSDDEPIHGVTHYAEINQPDSK